MKHLIFLALITSAAAGEAATFTFLPKQAAKGIYLDPKQPICIYLDHGYRPVTQSAVDAVAASGQKTCSDKAEAVLFAKTKKTFIKHNKSTLGDTKYNEIKLEYYKHLSKQ